MFGDKALEILKQFQRSSEIIPVYDEDGVKQVLAEIKAIFEKNREEAVNYSRTGNKELWPVLHFRHMALQRNTRCLIAYLYARLEKIRDIRWEFGPIIPQDIRKCLSESEINYFNEYTKSLATYMKSIDEERKDFDLTTNLKPPKSLYIEVRCVKDYGKFKLNDGEVILLKKNSQHYLPRNEVESLIRQGIVKHMT